MNFLQKLFAHKGKKQDSNLAAIHEFVEKNRDPDKDLMFDFEDQNEKTLDHMDDRVTDLLPSNSQPADQQVNSYKKAIAEYDKIKAFCESKGKGGSLYYQDRFAEDKKMVIDEYQSFVQEDYPEMKEAEKEEAEYKKYCKQIKSEIVKLASGNQPCLQKELYSHFSPEDKNLVLKLLGELVTGGKIIKQKQRNSYLLLINKKES